MGKNDETTAKELQKLLHGRGHKLPCFRVCCHLPLRFRVSVLACCFRSVVLLLPFRCFERNVQRRQNVNFFLTHRVGRFTTSVSICFWLVALHCLS